MSPITLVRQLPPKLLAATAFCVVFFCYYLIAIDFFPNRNNTIGHDYSLTLPSFLDAYFWHRNNSFFTVPWFTPSFCGGIPAFADVGNAYYSIPLFLTFHFAPLTSVCLSIFLFAAAGFWGMHRLLREVFSVGALPAFLGGTLFLFNGFYLHRMIVGHLGYQVFMLLPWVALLLLRSPTAETGGPLLGKLRQSACPVLAGVLTALLLQSSFASLMAPGALAVLAVACLHLAGHDAWRLFLVRSAIALAVALALSASKLVAGQAFLGNFPRSDYLLPGIDGIVNAVLILFTSLFIAPASIEQIAIPRMANMQWMLARHEWEFGMTFVPPVIIALYWANRYAHRARSAAPRPDAKPGRVAAMGLLGLILILPLAINVYHPDWNALLKRLPVFKNSSALIRWWIIYIPVVIVYAALALEKINWTEQHKIRFAIAAITAVVLINANQDRARYHAEPYNPYVITNAYEQTQDGTFNPEIQRIGATVNLQGQVETPLNRNDLLAYGQSQLACYNPAFGYRLENFPVKGLRPGSIYQETDGRLNLKNPACYVFPQENHCQPGDHFLASQIEDAKAFARYKPFPFAFSAKQKIANAVTVSALILVAALCAFYAASLAARKLGGKSNPPGLN